MFRNPIVLGGIAVIAVIYFASFAFSARGYGYTGYNGYHSGPSFWYWGGPRYYYPSGDLREGSLSGPDRRSGIGAGK